MPQFSGRGGGGKVSLARAQKLGIRTSQHVSSWSRSNSFYYAVRVTIILIAIIIVNALISFTIILSQFDFHRTSLQNNSSSPAAHISAEASKDICSSRTQHKWRNDLDRYFEESSKGISTIAVVLTVNNGFWDFFLNWHHHFQSQVMGKSEQPLLIIIAEDSVIYKKLKAMSESTKTSTNAIILPGYGSANDSSIEKAEDYDSIAYKSLVSSRATHILNLMCSIEGGVDDATDESSAKKGRKKDDIILVYSDVDAVWLKDPFPYIQTELFGSNNSDARMEQQPKYDILAAVDDHDYGGVSTYYCTGFLVMAHTHATISFLSYWEKELQANPQLNQPIFNTILQLSPELAEVRHRGLDETRFPPGRLYFDKWMKEGGKSEQRNKKEAIIVVHNNYIIGHDAKKKRFEEHGLWMDVKRR